MYPLSAAARIALRGSHQVTARATAYTPVGVMPDIPIKDGEITVDGKSQVRRTARVIVADPSLWPTSPLAALSPVGSELRIDFGIIIPGQAEPEWVPLIRGPIQKVSDRLPGTGGISVDVADRSAGVAADRLLVPGQTVAGATYVAEIRRLIQESQPAAIVTDLTGNSTVCPRLEIEAERWSDGIEKLADAIGAEVYADAGGDYWIRPAPTVYDPPVWRVDAGADGVLVTLSRELSRDRVYNAVTARGQRTDGTPPVSATALDDDPASPTYVAGPFGRRTRFYSSPLFTTNEQCAVAAAALLERTRGYVATIAAEIVPNPALDAGDVVEIRQPDGTMQRHILDAFPIPLGASGTQSLTSRTIDALPPEQAESAPAVEEGGG